MKSHITIIGILRIGMSAFWLISGCLVFSLLWGIGGFVSATDPTTFGILALVGSIIGGVLFVLSVPGIIGGFGLLKHKDWARYLVMILAVFDLFMFPIGTVYAIYTFWALVQEETVAMFTGEEVEAAEVIEEPQEVEEAE